MKKIVIILSVSIIMIFAALCSYFFVLKKDKIITYNLIGSNSVILNVFDTYSEDGLNIYLNNKLLDNTSYKINIISNLDSNKVGNYLVNYQIEYNHNLYNLNRQVSIVDNDSPIINLSSNEITMDYCSKKVKKEITFNAFDNYDGDLTDKVLITENDDKRIYSVSDSSGNTFEKEVIINYEKKPKDAFKLQGKSTIKVLVNTTFNDPGAKYTDGCGKKIDKDIEVSGNVDTSTLGTYEITYKLGDKTLKRKVVVYEKVVQPKTIYLTFDDGPGAQTSKILDILDKYNVKATFFVTHQFSNYVYLIGEEYARGHKIAAHTYSHNYKTVYSSVEGYVKDFNLINEDIKTYTGSYTNIFRFPGGSSNTVSKKYKSGVVSAIAREMTNNGYYYFDWNVDSKDAAGANQSKVYKEVVNGVEKCSSCVILMHDIKVATANALDNILNTLTSKGYTFKTLSESSPKIRHKIAN